MIPAWPVAEGTVMERPVAPVPRTLAPPAFAIPIGAPRTIAALAVGSVAPVPESAPVVRPEVSFPAIVPVPAAEVGSASSPVTVATATLRPGAPAVPAAGAAPPVTTVIVRTARAALEAVPPPRAAPVVVLAVPVPVPVASATEIFAASSALIPVVVPMPAIGAAAVSIAAATPLITPATLLPVATTFPAIVAGTITAPRTLTISVTGTVAVKAGALISAIIVASPVSRRVPTWAIPASVPPALLPIALAA